MELGTSHAFTMLAASLVHSTQLCQPISEDTETIQVKQLTHGHILISIRA